MPSDEFDDERPTTPDLAMLPCPTCRDESGRPTGELLRTDETASGYRSVRSCCTTCFGTLRVNRAAYERATSKGA